MKDISLGKIAQIAVMVRDLERATAFYRDKLGIPFVFNAPPKMAFFDCDGIRLMLGVPERADLAHAASILYFKVPDIDMAYEALSGRGVGFEGQPTLVAPMPTYDLWLVAFWDSANKWLALMCEKPK